MHWKQSFPRSQKLMENSSHKSDIQDAKTYKIVTIGACGVGKSALTLQYVSNVFLDFHEPTIEDAFQTQTVVDGQTGLVDILDTAGQDDVQTVMNEQYLRQGRAYIAVYSITDPSSINILRKQIQTLKRLRGSDEVPLVIVGNKLDLFNERRISTLEGIALARDFDCPFYEASAANRINIEDAFDVLVKQINKLDETNSDANNNTKKPKLKRFRKYVCKKIQNHIVL